MSSSSFDVDRFREAAQFAPVGLFLTDATGQCQWVNDAWCELTGMLPEEALGAGWVRMIHPEDLARIRATWRDRVKEETSGTSEFRLLRPDGEVRWVETNSRKLRGEQGELRGHVGSLVDITQRRRDAHEARERDMRLRAALDGVMDTLIFLSSVRQDGVIVDFRIDDANGGIENLLARPRHELIGRTLREAIAGMPDALIARYAAVVETGRMVEEERLQVTPARADRWARVQVARMGDGIVIATHDITLRKRHEEALRQREAALEQATSRLRSVLDATTEIAIMAVEFDRTISLFNTGAEKMLGYRASEVVGRTPDLFHVPGEVAASRPDLVASVQARVREHDERPGQAPLDEREWTYVRKDGSTLRVHVTLTARRNEAGELVGYLGVAKDITAHVAAASAMRQAKEAAESANRAKSEFLANVSHEIRTPLNGVLGLLELAIAEPEPASSAQLERLMLARRSAESLLLILNDLLDFAKIEAGKMVLAPRPFDLRAELDRLTQIASARAVDKGVTFRARVDALPERFVGDVDRLRQVLNNLLDNALKFTERGEVSLEVHSAPVGARQSRVTFAVADTGIGIPPGTIDRIFAPFEQADGSSTRRHGGTGLGLAICAELVKLMDGTLHVDSVVGQGSRFTVTLLGDVKGATSVPPPPVPLSPAALPPLRVLLVEDNPVNQIVASKMLERGGHRVWLASDGRAALDRLATDPFDVVLMDVQMPEMDGLEATRQLRERERAAGRRTPVIALTARAGASDRAEALEAGVDAYLVKPFRAAELHGAMREALEACAPTSDPAPG